MLSVAFPRLALHIARKDWGESQRIILGLTAALVVPALLVRLAPERSVDFARGLFAGIVTGAGFGYAQYCFINERQRGTLNLLLGLPVKPAHLVLAKYASLYSMVLFTVNVPALLVPDPRLVYIVNAAALVLATLFMAATVVSDKPWAPQLPIYLLLLVILPIDRILSRFYPGGREVVEILTGRPLVIATVAFLAVPALVMGSLWKFSRDARRE